MAAIPKGIAWETAKNAVSQAILLQEKSCGTFEFSVVDEDIYIIPFFGETKQVEWTQVLFEVYLSVIEAV